jgi:AAA family ATP:ADP antiporter
MSNPQPLPNRLSKSAWTLGVLIGFAAALVLAGYEFIRSPSNSLFVEYYGKQSLPTIMAAVPFVVFAFVYVYGRMVSAFGPARTLSITTILCSLVIIAGWYSLRFEFRPAAAVLYVFRSAYVVLLIEQYWSLINSSLSEHQAKRLNGPICGLASLGAIAGGLVGERLTIEYGTANMVLIAGLLSIPAVLLSSAAYRVGALIHKGTPRHLEFEVGTSATPSKAGHLGLKLLLQNRTLLLILIMVLLTQGLVTALGILFQGHLSDAFSDLDQQTSYSFRFYAIINALAGIGQFIFAPILLMYVRNQLVQVMMPMVMAIFVGVYLNDPGLTTAGWAFMAFKAIDYSVFRASKEILYIPLDFDARFRTKEVIDIFGYRLGKGAAGGLFDVIQRFGFKLVEYSYGLWSIVFIVGWLWAGISLGRKKTGAEPKAES